MENVGFAYVERDFLSELQAIEKDVPDERISAMKRFIERARKDSLKRKEEFDRDVFWANVHRANSMGHYEMTDDRLIEAEYLYYSRDEFKTNLAFAEHWRKLESQE